MAGARGTRQLDAQRQRSDHQPAALDIAGADGAAAAGADHPARAGTLSIFLRRIGGDLSARYVYFKCFDGYSTSTDMANAPQPQTILALDFEEKPLAPQWGAPLRLRIPTKLGFKSAKNLDAIEVTNKYPGGYWENQGYDWFAGV
jgi:DMSO/TMAO reductase YedYZ molybdopterin-dependent catalytic subunit